MAFFAADGGGVAVAGVDGKVVGQGGELAEGAGEGARVAAGEVGAAGGAAEEGVAGEEGLVVVEQPADAAGGVAGGFEDFPEGVAEFEGGVFGDVDDGAVWGGGGVVEAGEVVAGGEAPGGVEGVDVDGSGEGAGEFGKGGEVVDVAVGEQVGDDDGVEFAETGQKLGGVVAGIDHDGLAGGGVVDEVTIFF